jgi:hypothetical protein
MQGLRYERAVRMHTILEDRDELLRASRRLHHTVDVASVLMDRFSQACKSLPPLDDGESGE